MYRKNKKNLTGLAFVSPWVIGFLVFTLGPCFYTLVVSFMKWDLMTEPEFVGLQNYINLLDDDLFKQSLLVTFRFAVISVSISLVLSLAIALLLNVNSRVMYVYRTIFYIPSVVSGIAVAIVWSWIFSKDYGVLNYFLSLLGLDGPNWLGSPQYAPWAFVIIMATTFIGGPMIIFVAGLQNIPAYLYEAASLDGASKIQQFFKITLPMVSPTLFVVLIMRLMASLKVYDLIYMMVDQTNPALTNAQSLMYLFYRESFVAGNRGYASAIVVWTVLLIGAVTALQFWGQKKWVNYEV